MFVLLYKVYGDKLIKYTLKGSLIKMKKLEKKKSGSKKEMELLKSLALSGEIGTLSLEKGAFKGELTGKLGEKTLDS